MRRLIALSLVTLCVLALTGLGVWQVQRLMWKNALITAVNERTQSPPIALDAKDGQWPTLTQDRDEYRRVTVTGQFRHDKEVQVYALTEAGAGYWVMTPLTTANGATIFINRGYVPTDRRDPATRAEGQMSGPVTVTGLVRMSQDKGWLFLPPNDPVAEQWSLRDTKQMAKARGLGHVADYFVDADASPITGGWPKGGMTVVKFTNNHLSYALTWFAMAAFLAGFTVWWLRRPKTQAPKY
ncbi:SURF1 family protein [Asticcacaulis endophyticus]|uniref:SURF1-like protein n=1 Tax=Asticcacaulis endophyticus TaxID=1395890 RepID=A0A918Q774_9CAUL|nr:SURF1 family protein [Asticcacaulis endophyticus]GGZ33369.1 SURF1-like protein [Asticcacaulis endophyticus]